MAPIGLDPGVRALLQHAERARAWSRSEWAFLSFLPSSDFSRWRGRLAKFRTLPFRDRQESTSKLLADAVRRVGPEILAREPAQYHLKVLWSTMHRAVGMEARRHARKQWHAIFTTWTLPNYRKLKEQVRASAVLKYYKKLDQLAKDAYERTKGRPPAQLAAELRSRIPGIGPSTAQRLAGSYHHGDGDGVRDTLHRLAGSRFNRGPTVVRELLARARSRVRADEGFRRYHAFLQTLTTSVSLAPSDR
jgi:hypothetical protein